MAKISGKYEIVYIIDPAQGEEGIAALVEKFKAMVEAEGTLTSIEEWARAGKSIIMISSEMAELIGMSDRIMVMCDGRVTGFVDGKDATQENIMELATQFETV